MWFQKYTTLFAIYVRDFKKKLWIMIYVLVLF